VIAIDGPAGAGKSTLAAHLARKFGFLNLETGAMYRALAYKAIDEDLDLDDEAALLELCQHTKIELEPIRDGNRVLLDGRDVSRRIRDADVTAAASRASVHPKVREWMVSQQRALGASNEHEAVPVTESGVLAEMQARDERDRNRAESPLRPAEDAIRIDSTTLSLDEVLARSEEIVREHLEK
jgi:cytidylate kinase